MRRASTHRWASQRTYACYDVASCANAVRCTQTSCCGGAAVDVIIDTVASVARAVALLAETLLRTCQSTPSTSARRWRRRTQIRRTVIKALGFPVWEPLAKSWHRIRVDWETPAFISDGSVIKKVDSSTVVRQVSFLLYPREPQDSNL